MHLCARRPYAHAKVPGCAKHLGNVSPHIKDGVIVAINGFKTLSHVPTDFSFEILNLSRRAKVKLVVDLDGDLFHTLNILGNWVSVKRCGSVASLPINTAYFGKPNFDWFCVFQHWSTSANSNALKKMWRTAKNKVASL